MGELVGKELTNEKKSLSHASVLEGACWVPGKVMFFQYLGLKNAIIILQ